MEIFAEIVKTIVEKNDNMDIEKNTEVMLLPKEAKELTSKGVVLRLVDKDDKRNTPQKDTKGMVKRKYFIIGII